MSSGSLIYKEFFEKQLKNRFSQVKEWPEDHESIKIHLEWFERMITPIEPDFKVVDLGSRDAWLCSYLQDRVDHCVGIEALANFVEYWRGKGRNIEQGDICDLSRWEDGTFDLVFCRHAINMCESPAVAIREMKRVTAPGRYIHLILKVPGHRKYHFTYADKLTDVLTWCFDGGVRQEEVRQFGDSPDKRVVGEKIIIIQRAK